MCLNEKRQIVYEFRIWLLGFVKERGKDQNFRCLALLAWEYEIGDRGSIETASHRLS